MDDLIREMIAPARRSDLDRGRRSRLTATALTVGLAAIGVTSLTTGALFTDTDTVSNSDFTTGTVTSAPAMSTTHTLGAGNMAPGDVEFGTVPVANAGSLELRYSISVQGTNTTATPPTPVPDLSGQFQLKVYADVPEASCDAAGVASLTPIATMAGVPTALTPLVGELGRRRGRRRPRARLRAAARTCASRSACPPAPTTPSRTPARRSTSRSTPSRR